MSSICLGALVDMEKLFNRFSLSFEIKIHTQVPTDALQKAAEMYNFLGAFNCILNVYNFLGFLTLAK